MHRRTGGGAARGEQVRICISLYALERREERRAEHTRVAQGGARATHGARATTEAITHGAPRRPKGIAYFEERYGGRSGARNTCVSGREVRARHTERARRPMRSGAPRRDDRTRSRISMAVLSAFRSASGLRFDV